MCTIENRRVKRCGINSVNLCDRHNPFTSISVMHTCIEWSCDKNIDQHMEVPSQIHTYVCERCMVNKTLAKLRKIKHMWINVHYTERRIHYIYHFTTHKLQCLLDELLSAVYPNLDGNTDCAFIMKTSSQIMQYSCTPEKCLRTVQYIHCTVHMCVNCQVVCK